MDRFVTTKLNPREKKISRKEAVENFGGVVFITIGNDDFYLSIKNNAGANYSIEDVFYFSY